MAARTQKDPSPSGRAHALELVLAPDDDAAVRARWQRLEDAGVRSLARHRGATHRPHVTVATSLRPPGDDVLYVARRRWAPLLPLALPVSGLSLLGSRRVTVAELLDVPRSARAARDDVVSAWEDADDRPWLAHLTLATRLDHGDAARAVTVLGEPTSADLTRTCIALRCWNPDAETVTVVTAAE